MATRSLKFMEYNIAGNVIRAYYDADDKLIFILDKTISDDKPNVLLVINPVGDRKWDDILANDYGVDLETVRPKKNNKYQKLDIEYSGLSEYDDLINAYKAGSDLSEALENLTVFRYNSVRRSAMERLSVAESNAEKARDTIVRTKESIAEMQDKLKQMRAKLSQQKKQIGREPTKKSASKILRTDAQIDALNEKIRRAKKRLDNAQRRLIVADEDAELARDILDKDKSVGMEVAMPRPTSVIKSSASKNVATSAANSNKSVRLPISTEYAEDITVTETADIKHDEQKAEQMADETNKEEVKPLFDEDPEILDEEIAFKPIEFGVSSPIETKPIPEQSDVYESVVEEKPLSFTPPEQNSASASSVNVNPVNEQIDTAGGTVTQPVLDTIKSVNMPKEEPAKLDSELTTDNGAPVIQNSPSSDTTASSTSAVRPVPPAATISNAAAAVRPVSPITGSVAPTNPAQRKPTLVYYIMLVLLIGLSIFTLWLYQKNTSEKTPDLMTTVPTTEIVEETTSTELDSPFIIETQSEDNNQTMEVSVEEAPYQLIEPDYVEENIDGVTESDTAFVEINSDGVDQNAVVETESVTPVADFYVEPISVPEPVVTEPEPVVTIPTEEEILATKPSYNVSQNENMFIADPEYDTETNYIPSNDSGADLPTCPDGTAPDINGCCAGEIYTDMGSMGFNCCPPNGGDCFPPLL